MLEYKEFKRIERLRKLLKDSYKHSNVLIDFLVSIKNANYNIEIVDDYIYYHSEYLGLIFYRKYKNKYGRVHNIRTTSDFLNEFDNKYVESYGGSAIFDYKDYRDTFLESYLKDLDFDNDSK